MVKKKSESPRSAEPVRTSAATIWNKPLTKRQKTMLEGIAARQARGDAERIEYFDIPPLTEKQLAWLIDAETKTVEIYRPGAAPEIHRNAVEVAAGAPVDGFVLKLARVWDPIAR